MMDHLRQVIGSPLWALVRNFLTYDDDDDDDDDVLYMRTTTIKWSIVGLYGPFCRAVLLLVEGTWTGKTRSSSRMALCAL